MPLTGKKANTADQGPSILADVPLALGSATIRGVAGIPGAPADIAGMVGDVYDWGQRKLTGETPEDQQARLKAQGATDTDQLRGTWGSEAYVNEAEKAGVPGMRYEPQTLPGKFADVGGEMIGGSLLSIFGAMTKLGTKGEQIISLGKQLLAQGIAPAAVSETLGQIADRYVPEWSTIVRAGGALTGSIGGSLWAKPNAPPNTVNVPGIEGEVRTTAARNAGRGIEAEGGPQFGQEQLNQVGPGGVLADIGPNMRGQTVQTAITPGANQQTVRQFLNRRAEEMQGGRDTRLNTVLDTLFEPRSRNFAEESVEMSNARRQRADDLYGEARRRANGGTAPVPQDRALAYIDTLIPDDVRAGTTAPLPEHAQMMELRRYFEGDRTYNDVDQLKGVLQNRIDAARNRGEAPADLIHLKEEVVRSLEDATRNPDGTSPYRAAQRAYRQDSDILDRRTEGQNFFDAKERPGEFQLRWSEMSPEEQQSLRMGLRESIADTMDTANNNFVTGTNQLRKQGNQEKLAIIMGDAEAERLQAAIEGLRRQRGTSQDIVAQSATEARRRGMSQIEDPEKASNLKLSSVQTATGAATLGAEWTANQIANSRRRTRAEASNTDQARILTQSLDEVPPEQRMAMLQRLHEVYRDSQRSRLPASSLLALNALYQTERMRQNGGQ